MLCAAPFSVLSRRHPVNLLERTVEGPLALETGLQADFRNRKIRILQAGTDKLQPLFVQILVKVLMKRGRKDSG